MDSTHTTHIVGAGRKAVTIDALIEAGRATVTLSDRLGHTEHVTLMPTGPVAMWLGSSCMFGPTAWVGIANGSEFEIGADSDDFAMVAKIRDREIRRALIATVGKIRGAVLATLPEVQVVAGATTLALLGVDSLPATMTAAEALEWDQRARDALNALAAA